MSNKKRYVTEEEVYAIANGRIKQHEEHAKAHSGWTWYFFAAGIILFVLAISGLSFVSHNSNQSWQPINCVNETQNGTVCGNDYICNYPDTLIVDDLPKEIELTCHLNCTDIEVPTGRQICSQKMLVKNETTFIVNGEVQKLHSLFGDVN